MRNAAHKKKEYASRARGTHTRSSGVRRFTMISSTWLRPSRVAFASAAASNARPTPRRCAAGAVARRLTYAAPAW